ncbi:pyruvate kinase, partial [Haemophilus influenzae]
CENDEVFIKEEKIPLAQAFGWGESLGDFRVNFMFIISTSSWCWRFWFLKIF